MKTLSKLSFILLISISLFGCGNVPPIINDKEDLFIVGEIQQRSKTHSIYYKNRIANDRSPFRSNYEAIVLPTGMYNIGDTITLLPSNNN